MKTGSPPHERSLQKRKLPRKAGENATCMEVKTAARESRLKKCLTIGCQLCAWAIRARAVRRLRRARAELHMMGPAELCLVEIDCPLLLQLFAVPAEKLQELLVVGAFLVPICEQGGSDIDPFPVPALGHHVDLRPGVRRIGFLGGFRVRQIEVMGHSVHE